MELLQEIRVWLEALPTWVVNGSALLALFLAVFK